MSYGFWGTLDEFINFATNAFFSNMLSHNREITGGAKLSQEERDVWTSDINILKPLFTSLSNKYGRTLFVGCEYDIPGHLGRCDLVLVGIGNNRKLVTLVVELKSWTDFSLSNINSHVRINGEYTLHPLIQVQQYANRLKIFHELSDKMEVYNLVLMTKATQDQVNKITVSGSKKYIYSVIDQEDDINNIINQKFVNKIVSDEYNLACSFVNGRCIASALFAYELFRKLPSITSGISEAISNVKCLDLSIKQQEVVESILHSTEQKDKTLILISGQPGSGKTIVGLHSIVYALLNNIENGHIRKGSLLALRNNRLCTVVRAAIDDIKQGWGKAIVQYIKGGTRGIGIYYDVLDANPRTLPLYDLVVVDEAHRLPNEPNSKLSQLDSILYSAKTVVCLIDENQTLNPDDNGNLIILKNRWKQLFKSAPILEYKLDEQYRLPLSYSMWIEGFLAGKCETFNFDEYDLKVASNESEVIKYLKQKSTEGFSCGILASYTKCNGRNGNDLRIPTLGVRWLMKPDEYNIWWRNKNIRHRFDKCASVYGSQGFELDYAALFWGNDLCFSLSDEEIIEFLICPRNDITDDIGQAYGKKFHTRVREALLSYNDEGINQAINDLKNRYRILLSRAKKGLIIFFENPHNRTQFLKILKYNL